MDSANLNKFLKALEDVKNDYKCPVCSQYCRDPVTLSKCFHIICAEHFEGLKTCPTCQTDLQGCTKFYDDRLSSCVDATKKLDAYFNSYVANLTHLTDVNIPDLTNDSDSPDMCAESEKKENKTKDQINKATRQKPILKNNSGLTDKKSPHKIETIDITTSDKKLRPKRQTPDSKNIPEKVKNISNTKVLTRSDSNTSVKNTQQAKAMGSKAKYASVELKKSQSTEQESEITLNTSTGSKFSKGNEKRNHKGETLLHIACRLGKIERVTELLNQGANPNTKDNAGWTPLHEVVQNGRLDLVRLLLQYNTLIDVPGQSNETPLHEAIRYNYEDIAIELVKHGADIYARNCKGETPYQLASVDMKTTLLAATEQIIQTQSVNISHMSLLHSEMDFDDIRVYCISQFRTVLTKLKILAKAHSNLTVENKFSKKVTHLIVDADDGVCKLSVDVLQGIANSLWILSSEWITKSTEDTLEPFEKYEVVVENKSNDGPKNSRYNKYKQLPRIFDGCHFYLHSFGGKHEITKDLVLTKANLSKLITDAGGVVLQRVPNPEAIPDEEKLVPYHAKKDGKLMNCTHYIIFKDTYQPMYNMHHLKALPIGWLIECFEKYQLCEPWPL